MAHIGSTTAYPVAIPVPGDRFPFTDSATGALKQATASSIGGVSPVVTVLSIAAGVVNIDCSLGDYFTLALTANVTSITFSNLPGSGRGASKMVRVTQDSTPRTVAWPASFRWEGAAPSVSTGSGAIDLLALTTFDNGTKWDTTLSKGRV